MVLAPQTRRGTIHTKINDEGQPQFVFRLDPRFRDNLPEFFINDGDVEECLPPSDVEVAAIRALIRAGS
jgi:hypothetical protein